jgi:hypothetical protein
MKSDLALEQRWVAHYTFHWLPLVSFKQRRDTLAVWIDDNVLPLAVLGQDDTLGVAIGNRALRVTVDKSGFGISVGAPGLDVSTLEAVFDGILSIMRPAQLHIAAGRTLSTAELDFANYDNTRQKFSRQCAGSLDDRFKAVDGSVTVDLATKTSLLQVTFGVVSNQEIRERLRKPLPGSKSRLALPPLLNVRSKIPDVSLLFDVDWHPLRSLGTNGDQDLTLLWQYILNSVEAINGDASAIGHALVRNMRERGTCDELDRGA